jgi:hypothetical protein
VTVPAGETLTVHPYASILFEDEKKITAAGSGTIEGFFVSGTSDLPVYFLSLTQNLQSEHIAHGVKLEARLRLQNGGEIKLY